MKRFWDRVETGEKSGGYAVLLDGKPMRIPGGAPLLVRSGPLAEAIAAEWRAAGGERGGTLSLEEVPLTRLAGTAQERIAPDPGPVARELARYAETDLLCYRAERPEALMVRQARTWQPWLDWLERRHGARLVSTEGVIYLAQDSAALERVRAVMAVQTPETLAGLGLAVPSLGSAVLGLALAEGALDAEGANQAASLDEVFETELWGEDAEAVRRRAQVAEDVALAERFIRLAAA